MSRNGAERSSTEKWQVVVYRLGKNPPRIAFKVARDTTVARIYDEVCKRAQKDQLDIYFNGKKLHGAQTMDEVGISRHMNELWAKNERDLCDDSDEEPAETPRKRPRNCSNFGSGTSSRPCAIEDLDEIENNSSVTPAQREQAEQKRRAEEERTKQQREQAEQKRRAEEERAKQQREQAEQKRRAEEERAEQQREQAERRRREEERAEQHQKEQELVRKAQELAKKEQRLKQEVEAFKKAHEELMRKKEEEEQAKQTAIDEARARATQEATEAAQEQTLCTICMERPKVMCLKPCNHVCLCEECWQKFPQEACPICRKLIEGIEKVYM